MSRYLIVIEIWNQQDYQEVVQAWGPSVGWYCLKTRWDLLYPTNELHAKKITSEHTASDRLLLGNLWTAYQWAIPILPRENHTVLIQETWRDRSEAIKRHNRWEILSRARVGSRITHLTRVWVSPEDELKRCTWERHEGTKQHLKELFGCTSTTSQQSYHSAFSKINLVMELCHQSVHCKGFCVCDRMIRFHLLNYICKVQCLCLVHMHTLSL